MWQAELSALLATMPFVEDPSVVTQKETLVMPTELAIVSDWSEEEEEDKENMMTVHSGTSHNANTPHRNKAHNTGTHPSTSPTSVLDGMQCSP